MILIWYWIYLSIYLQLIIVSYLLRIDNNVIIWEMIALPCPQSQWKLLFFPICTTRWDNTRWQCVAQRSQSPAIASSLVQVRHTNTFRRVGNTSLLGGGRTEDCSVVVVVVVGIVVVVVVLVLVGSVALVVVDRCWCCCCSNIRVHWRGGSLDGLELVLSWAHCCRWREITSPWTSKAKR